MYGHEYSAARRLLCRQIAGVRPGWSAERPKDRSEVSVIASSKNEALATRNIRFRLEALQLLPEGADGPLQVPAILRLHARHRGRTQRKPCMADKTGDLRRRDFTGEAVPFAHAAERESGDIGDRGNLQHGPDQPSGTGFQFFSERPLFKRGDRQRSADHEFRTNFEHVLQRMRGRLQPLILALGPVKHKTPTGLLLLLSRYSFGSRAVKIGFPYAIKIHEICLYADVRHLRFQILSCAVHLLAMMLSFPIGVIFER